jgi:hypothetical protein
MGREFWTEEDIERLTFLWVKQRFSTNKIAEMMCRTRNMIAGKISRLHLHGVGGTALTGRTNPKMRAPRVRVRRKRISEKRAPRTPDVILPPDEGNRCTLMELRKWTPDHAGTCRFPTWQTPTDPWTRIPPPDKAFYCGEIAPTSSGPYCAFHSKVAYETASARMARLLAEKMEAGSPFLPSRT